MKRLFWIVIVILLLIAVVPVIAQDAETALPQRVRLPGSYQIYVPESWTHQRDEDTGGTYLLDKKEDFTVFILMPDQVAELVEITDETTAKSLMVDINTTLYDFTIPDSSILESKIGDYNSAIIWYPMEGGDYEGYSYIIQFDAGSFAFVDAYGPTDSMEALGAILVDTLATFGPIPTGTGETCYVNTDQERTANLRVGPGENRTSIAFLPVGEDFEVMGRFVADDDSVWYQLDKEQAAPRSSAAEIWVAQTLVNETGDCEGIGETTAPPLIPIVSGNPPSGGSGGGNAPPPNVGSGGWLAVLSDEADTSCAGTPNFHVRTTEVFSTQSFGVSISISGNTLYFDGIAFPRQSSGAYYGSIPLANGNAQLTLRVVSANQITGQMIGNAVFDGQGCSVTMGITITH